MRWLTLFIVLCLPAPAQDVPKPRILGVSHMALYATDLAKSRAFYTDLLGFAESSAGIFHINEDQYIELHQGPPGRDGQLHHIAFYADGKSMNLSDPDAHTVEVVERRRTRAPLPITRISTRIMHVGALIAELAPAMKFYRDGLGFQEFWRGSRSGKVLDWVNMRVPNGQDYLEFMLYETPPNARERGVRNHVCLEVADIQKAVAILESRRAHAGYDRPIEVRTGVNRKRQANLYDPDGTRVELMEPNTIDGQPAPSSTAPPPR